METGGARPPENAAMPCPIISDNRRQRVLEIKDEPSGRHADSPANEKEIEKCTYCIKSQVPPESHNNRAVVMLSR